MSIELQKAESRLDNVQKVTPILTALRTISLGSWQMARNRRSGLSAYTDRLLALLPLLVPHLARRGPRRLRLLRRRGQEAPQAAAAAASSSARHVILVVGAERGLCGQYNAGLLDELARSAVVPAVNPRERGRSLQGGNILDEAVTSPPTGGIEGGSAVGSAAPVLGPASSPSPSVDILALGTRLIRDVKRAGYTSVDERAMSITSLPSFELAHALATDWLTRYEAYELDAVDVVYNADRGTGTYGAATVRLIPPELPAMASGRLQPDEASASPELVTESPAAILETDPVRLYVRVIEQWTAIALYKLLLEGALTEHSARYQLMESATQNADDIVAELMLAVKSARRQAITREMQELAVSAGLLSET